jgi:hypothetical protein
VLARVEPVEAVECPAGNNADLRSIVMAVGVACDLLDERFS